MSKDVKFTISIISDEYKELKKILKYEILGYREVTDDKVRKLEENIKSLYMGRQLLSINNINSQT